jgi:hypothetical protein
MASFDAGGVVEPLDYDFTAMAAAPHSITGLAGVKGTIREPTSVQVQTWLTANAKEMQQLRQEGGAEQAGPKPESAADGAAELPDAAVTDALLAGLAEVDPKKVRAARLRQAKIYSALCSGEPTAEQLALLPHRIMNAFADWLSREVLDPEAVTGAGRPPLQIVRSSAAG